jgi:hypothetical protein
MKLKVTLATVALVLTAVALALTTAALLSSQKTISTTGQISTIGVEVYSDANATTPCSSINWGTLNPGGTANQTVYVKNPGNTAETLSMTTSGWNPSSATSVLTLSWDKQTSSLGAGSVVAATFTLTVASDIGDVSSFSFNILVEGSA